MITNRKVCLLAFLAIVLTLTFTSCSDPGRETTAEVRVIGTAVSQNAEVSARAVSSEIVFGSGTVHIDGTDITGQLTPVDNLNTTGNDIEFGANVPVIGNTVTYSVEPKEGFVFDEWKITRENRQKIKKENPNNWWDVIREIENAIKGDNQTITINPDYIKYLRPTFDRGIYFGAEDDIQKIRDFINTNRDNRYDDDELTIKFSKDVNTDLDLSQLHYWDDLEIELKLLGGYDENWNLSDERTTFTSIDLPAINDFEEIEIEFRNIHFGVLDHSKYQEIGEDDDIEFGNCSVGKLEKPGKIVNGLVIEKIDSASQGITFTNSDVPYVAGSTYFHSIIRDYESGTINGSNNIIIAEKPETSTDENNRYIANFGENYKNEALRNDLITAIPLSEDIADIDDDYLEEDIEGRERFLREDEGDDDDDDHHGNRYSSIRVSYGPYEYQWFDD